MSQLDILKYKLEEKFVLCVNYYSASVFGLEAAGNNEPRVFKDISISDMGEENSKIYMTGQFRVATNNNPRNPTCHRKFWAVIKPFLDDFEVVEIRQYKSDGTSNTIFPLYIGK